MCIIAVAWDCTVYTEMCSIAGAIVGSNSNRASVTQRVTYDHSSALIGYYLEDVKNIPRATSINNFSPERVDSKGLYGR